MKIGIYGGLHWPFCKNPFITKEGDVIANLAATYSFGILPELHRRGYHIESVTEKNIVDGAVPELDFILSL